MDKSQSISYVISYCIIYMPCIKCDPNYRSHCQLVAAASLLAFAFAVIWVFFDGCWATTLVLAALVFSISCRNESSKLSSLKESSQHDPQQPAFRLHSHEPHLALSAIVSDKYIITKALTGHTPGFKRRGATQTCQDSKRKHIQLQRYMPLNHHTAGTATSGYAIWATRHVSPRSLRWWEYY